MGGMLKKALLPLDGSRLSEFIIPFITSLLPDSSTIYVLVVTGDQHESCDVSSSIKLLHNHQRSKSLKVRLVVRTGSPAAEILCASAELKADIIALSTHGNTGLFSLSMGSVSQEVTARSAVPLFLLKPRDLMPRTPTRYQKLLVPLDGSATMEKAVPLALDFARRSESSVTFVRIGENPYWQRPKRNTGAFIHEHYIHQYLRRHMNGAQANGIRAGYIYDRGDPCDKIWRTAIKADADLVVSGTCREARSHWLLGTYIENIVRKTNIPALLV